MALGWTDFISRRWMRIKVQSVFAVLAILLVWSVPSQAKELPDPGKGYMYYCAAERSNGWKTRSNALIVLKLLESNVVMRPKSRPTCYSKLIDDKFVLDAFFDLSETKYEDGVLFRMPIELNNSSFSTRFAIVSGDYANKGKLNSFNSWVNVCGVSRNPDEYDLFQFGRTSNSSCKGSGPGFYGKIRGSEDIVTIRCWEEIDGECSMFFYFKKWKFSVHDIPRELLLYWRDLHQKFLNEVESRVVFYLGPDACEGQLDCKALTDKVYGQ